MIEELVDRFEQKTVMEPVLALESLLLKSANGECFDEQLKKVKESVFQSDLDFDRLQKQLGVLVDVIRQALPSVTKVTKVRTICDAMNVQDTYKEMFTETHKLLRLYLTIPITSSTSERAFSTLRRVLTYIRSSMTEKRLNNCIMLHMHKSTTDSLKLQVIAKEFIHANNERLKYFGNFQ